MHLAIHSILWNLIMIDNGLQEGFTIPQPYINDYGVPAVPTFQSWREMKYLEVGMVIGTLMSLFMIDSIGRKTTLLMTAFPKILSWLLLGSEHDRFYSEIGRLIAGIGCGIVYVALPIYLCEITPTETRGSIGMFMGVFFRIGTLLFLCIPRWIPIVMILGLPIVYWSCHKWTFESPEFFATRGQVSLTEQALQDTLGKEDIKDELVERMTNGRTSNDILSLKESFIALFKNIENKRAMTIALTLTNSLVLTGWFPISVFQFYAFGNELSVSFNIIYTLSMIIAGVAGALFVPKFGRKSTLMQSYYLMLFAAILGLWYLMLSIIGPPISKPIRECGFIVYGLIYASGYGLASGSLPFVYIGEVFCSKVKVLGVVLCILYYVSMKAFVSELHQLVMRSTSPFGFLGVLSVLIIWLVYSGSRWVPNDDDRPSSKVQIKLKNGDLANDS